jgi:hypothetical protein
VPISEPTWPAPWTLKPTEASDTDNDTCITCQHAIEPDEPAEQDSPAGGRWHTRCADKDDSATAPNPSAVDQ